MIALGLLPALVVLAWAALLSRRGRGGRDAVATAAVDGAVWLVLGVEILGAVRAVSLPAFLLWWSIPGVLVATAHRARLPPLRIDWGRLRPASAGDGALLLLLLALLAWAFLQATLAPPNNVDALSYHLPRQVHWLQRGSVAHYPTSVLRQLTMPPLAEYAGLTLLALTGGDRGHNLVQWAAMVGTLLVVSGLTRDLGGDRRAQLLSAFFVVTAPSAFVQASGPKNDLVLMFFLSVAAWKAVRAARDGSLLDDARLGATFGLLALTKGTGLLYGPPVAMLALRRLGVRTNTVRRAAVIVAAAALLNAGHWMRNLDAFGSLYGPSAAAHGGQTVASEIVTPASIVSNAVRTLTAELALPFDAWNRALQGIVIRTHAALGLSPDDPRTTYRIPPYEPPAFFPRDEDSAVCPVHVVAGVLLPLIVWTRRRTMPAAGALELWAAGVAAFLVFCVALKWQLWHPRIVFPLLGLVAPIAGLALAALGRAAVLPGLLFVAVLAPSLNVGQRPLIGEGNLFTMPRLAAYLNGAPDLRPACTQAVMLARQIRPRIVGVLSGWSGYEYALQVYLDEGLEAPVHFTAFNASFVPRGTREPDPDLVIALDDPRPALTHEGTGTLYVSVGAAGRLTFFVPRRAPAPGAP